LNDECHGKISLRRNDGSIDPAQIIGRVRA
jgi:hypothetical protein